MFNLSSRFADLPPVVAAAAQASGLQAIGKVDAGISQVERDEGKSPSSWVLVTDRPANDLRDWAPIRTSAQDAWTDDLSSVLPVLRWQ